MTTLLAMFEEAFTTLTGSGVTKIDAELGPLPPRLVSYRVLGYAGRDFFPTVFPLQTRDRLVYRFLPWPGDIRVRGVC